MYREQVLKKKGSTRISEQKGRTEASKAGFYNTVAWHRIRDRRAREEPLCRMCLAKGRMVPGRVVDHIIAVEDAPGLALDYDNTQHLCDRCHTSKTMADKKKRVQQARELNGRFLMQKFETTPTPGG